MVQLPHSLSSACKPHGFACEGLVAGRSAACALGLCQPAQL